MYSLQQQQVHKKGNGKFRPIKSHEDPEEEYRYSFTLSLTSTLDGGGWSTPRLCRAPPPPPARKRHGTHFTGGWVEAGPFWTEAGKLSPTRIRSPDRPSRSESL
jgi:hypothetical protein